MGRGGKLDSLMGPLLLFTYYSRIVFCEACYCSRTVNSNGQPLEFLPLFMYNFLKKQGAARLLASISIMCSR